MVKSRNYRGLRRRSKPFYFKVKEYSTDGLGCSAGATTVTSEEFCQGLYGSDEK
jgi:hypothetical protein